ncbi:MAG: exodeoxyribonuclease VII large subunit [Planctomycetaceae bacterium]|jgi:exodeoxyribonuclease VII large subunit|nr:exodeoxyribonuclease VII large subunit [Planctomycetaceae bacterium]
MQNPIEPLTVGLLTAQIKGLLETAFEEVWVLGETSGVSKPRSGHCYLTLKDENAQLPAVVWKSAMLRVKFDIRDGQMVLCHGRIDVYPPHGKYQLVIDHIEPLGQGELELAFRQLHAKLEAEGLFAPEKKRPLPQTVRRIGLVTSPTGAAVRDFLQILGRRTRRINVLIIPVRVQGDGASREIARAIQRLNDSPESVTIDCLVITRGGGSQEDLWTFNEEPLVRAVAASKIPTISAVGHEIDITLCDLAADFRALTPSEAAERISPNDTEKMEILVRSQLTLERFLSQKIEVARQKIRRFEEHPLFKHPKESLVYSQQRNLDLLEEKLHVGIEKLLNTAKTKTGQYSSTLEALSPLSILNRGYSLTFNENNQLLHSVNDARPHQEIHTTLTNGTIISVVQDTIQNSNSSQTER